MATERSRLLEETEEARVEPESLNSVQSKSSATAASSGRISTFDLTRGLICLLMAIDHTFFISGKEHPTESYLIHPDRHHLYLSSWYHYGLRFVTHTCAPGFSILMGLGIVYFVESRVGKLGWSLPKTAKYITIRGLLFMVVGYVSTIPWAFSLNAYLMIDIIITLGIDFILGGLLVLLIRSFERPKHRDLITAAIALLAVLSACLTVFLVRYKDSVMVQLLWLSGNTPNSTVVSRFPPLSWLPLVLYGIFFGRLTQRLPRRTATLSFAMSILFLLLFLAVRLPGKFGNLTPVKPSWYRRGPKEFFWTNKYCPDLAFITLFTSIIHLFITLFALLPADFPGLTLPLLGGSHRRLNTNQVLLDIGTSPFAFYFIHMYSLMLIGTVLKALGWVWTVDELGPGYTAPGLGNGWLYWCVYAVLILWMWFVCRSYGRFKASRSVESVWRYF